MATAHLRERLDRLLMIVEESKDLRNKGLVAFILDIIPETLPEIQKDILVIGKPSIYSLMGRTKTYRRDRAVKELSNYSTREDIFGQICDLMLRIGTNVE